MADSENDVDVHLFMQALFQSILEIKKGRSVPGGLYQRGLQLTYFAAIATTTAAIIKEFTGGFELITSILLHGNKCAHFVELLGYQLFEKNAFSWDLFRSFLAILCELSLIAFGHRKMPLSDDLLIYSALYIRKELVEKNRISALGGWKSFQIDCFMIDLKITELEVYGPVDYHQFSCEKLNFPQKEESRVCYFYEGQPLGHITFDTRHNCMKIFFLQKEGDNMIESTCSGSENGKIVHLRNCMLAQYVSKVGADVVKLL